MQQHKRSSSMENGSDPTSESSVRKPRPRPLGRRSPLQNLKQRAQTPNGRAPRPSSDAAPSSTATTNTAGSAKARNRAEPILPPGRRKPLQQNKHSAPGSRKKDTNTSNSGNRNAGKFAKKAPSPTNASKQRSPLQSAYSTQMNVSSTQSMSSHAQSYKSNNSTRKTSPKSTMMQNTQQPLESGNFSVSSLRRRLIASRPPATSQGRNSNRSSTESTHSPPTTSPSTSSTSRRPKKTKGKLVMRPNLTPSPPRRSLPKVRPSVSAEKCGPNSTKNSVNTAVSGSPPRAQKTLRGGPPSMDVSQCSFMTPPKEGKSVMQMSLTQEESMDQPVPEFSHNDVIMSSLMREFANYCAHTSIRDLSMQFEQLRKIVPTESQCSACLKPCNQARNRYHDIYCIDATRVVLRFPEGTSDDYVHANIVAGRRLHNRFILTQGPLPKTIPDFWRMVWAEGATLIYMLCDYHEDQKRKCSEYLPPPGEEGIIIAGIKVVLLTSIPYPKRCLTETRLRLTCGEKHLSVVHWRWTGWPDYKVPSQDLTTPFMLLTHARNTRSTTVVHCSAGVGRSGSLVALELCLTDMAEGIKLNVQEVVEFLRRQRAHSVQSESQYLFIHRALLDFGVSSKLVQSTEIERFVKAYDEFMTPCKAGTASQMGTRC